MLLCIKTMVEEAFLYHVKTVVFFCDLWDLTLQVILKSICVVLVTQTELFGTRGRNHDRKSLYD